MSKNNSERKKKPLAGISLKVASGIIMALFLFAVTLNARGMVKDIRTGRKGK